MDWRTGVWQPSGRQATGTLRITFAADWAPLRHYQDRMEAGGAAIFGDLLPVFEASHLNIVNVESVLGEKGSPIPKAGPNLRGSERSVRALAEAPFHVACLANNHTLDYGPEGLEHTLTVLAGAGLRTVGAGTSGAAAAAPLVLEAGGLSVGLINCAEGEECRSVGGGPGVYGLDVHAVAAQIGELRARCDVVLVVFHGGREHTPLPPPYVVRDLRRLAEAGATAVIAHHPHVPQGVEIHRGVPIAYSLGNFAFWQENDLFYRHAGYLVTLDVAGSEVARLELVPYLIEREGLRKMPEGLREAFLADLESVSEPLRDDASVEAAWEAFVDRFGLKGLAAILRRHLDLVETDPVSAAARLKNLFFTPAHSEFFINGLGRAAANRLGSAPPWAARLVERWLTLKYEERVGAAL